MRTSQTQFVIMIEFMERYGDLSKPSAGPNGRQRNLERWKELTQKLNSEGSGDPRSEEKWRKVWSDYKNNAKKKAAKISRGISGTGGGPPQKIWLTDLEERVISIIGEQAATGIPNIPEAGFAKTVVEEDIDIVIVAAETQNDNEKTAPTPENDQYNFVIGDEDWNRPGCSSDPPTSEPVGHQQDHPKKRATPSSTSKWVPPPKRAKNLDMATEAFLACEKGRDDRYFELEQERMRQRDTELQIQKVWQEIAKDIIKLIQKYLDKNG